VAETAGIRAALVPEATPLHPSDLPTVVLARVNGSAPTPAVAKVSEGQ
jgi:hypothetical protein